MNENLLKNLGCIIAKQSPLGPPLGTPLTMIPPQLFHRLSQDQRQNKPYTDHILKSLRLFVSNDPLILRTVPSLVRFKADVQLQFIDCFSVSGKLQYLKSFHCWAKLVKTVILNIRQTRRYSLQFYCICICICICNTIQQKYVCISQTG